MPVALKKQILETVEPARAVIRGLAGEAGGQRVGVVQGGGTWNLRLRGIAGDHCSEAPRQKAEFMGYVGQWC